MNFKTIDKKMHIREMKHTDIDNIVLEEIKQGWHPTREKYLNRFEDAKHKDCLSLVAIYEDQLAGYINLYIRKKNGPYKDTDIPEIIDLGVFERFRNLGIGTALMDSAEKLAKTYSDKVYLAVGLHSGYGRAQQMYMKRGYIPEGSGAYYKDKVAIPYKDYPLDDDLVIYMIKEL